jgi:hypothetical protein
MRFIRQVLVQDESLAVSTVRTDDLPVNPVSVILMTVKMLNDTGTLTDFQVFSSMLAQIAKVEVLYQGSAVVSGSLADLARMNAVLVRRTPAQIKTTAVNNDVRAITVPIMLGRKAYWADECFPAVRRGELQLQTTSAAAQTGVDTIVMQIETVELPDAKPKRYAKYTTISKTPSATGDHDVDLPLGNPISGTLLFGTTAPTGASYNASIGQLRLLVDNVEAYYARTNWETLRGDIQLRTQAGPQASSHVHVENTAALYTQNATTDKNQESADFFNNYAFLDFDPREDDSYLLDTKGHARVHLRINAEAADAIRVLPLELITVAGA